MLAPGTLLHERYRLGRIIGRGGFSTVYLAADTRLAERPVAVKVIHVARMELDGREWIRDHFIQEASLLGQLRHPGIVDVYDFFAEGDNAYLVMEYLAGRTLRAYLAEQPGRRLPQTEAVAIARELANVLDYLHEWQDPESGTGAPIIYRDLKPENVMILDDGTVKLLDFGIARTFKADQGHDTRRLGTPGYAAPEQYGEGQSDARSDVYSLGVLLHEMLGGHDPADTPLNLPPLGSLVPSISPVLAAAVAQATALKPENRFFSMGAFARALDGARLQSGAQGPPPPPGPPPSGEVSGGHNRARRLRLGAAAGLLLLIPLLIWLNRTSAQPEPTATPEAVVLVVTATAAPTGTVTITPTASPSPTPSPTWTPSPSPTPTSTATPTRLPGPYFSDAYFCLTPCLPDGSNSTDAFPAGITEIFTRWRYEDIPPNARYERIWTSNGQEYVRYDCIWPGPGSGVDDEVVLTHSRGLRAGTWELTIRVEGQTVLQEQITLTGNHDYWRPVGTFNRCYGTR